MNSSIGRALADMRRRVDDQGMAGELDEFIDALTAEDQAARLAAEE